ncbi:hypothetical protein HYH03_012344 [Edaphochlamys debaryana]|uniref:Protein kintoun n=1 Tax=Edaphochlamys debaryana TaxID=47281 RepID=A0A836BVJ5_9CHLO|nr:hypothetical protein HYH03_012344 [Edaphochlamys debaryana]|eukprot:KAG2489118.1 hypothetical protein HYH03_012344 [Edaphochlamys debaryana]
MAGGAGTAKKPADSLEHGLKELNLTNEELTKFEKAFKDPEFMKLFEEYAKEVSDPKVKAETDAYLRQIEQQGRDEDVYGKGVQLVVPEPAAVVKTKVMGPATGSKDKGDAETGTAGGKGLPVGQKVFINVCTCDKVGKYSLEEAKDARGTSGKRFSMPLTLGPKRVGTDKHGQPAAVYDFVVHPDSWAFGLSNVAAMNTLVETALEHVERVSGSRLSHSWRRLNTRYKGTEGADTPPVQCIRTAEGGEAVDGRLKPRPNVPGAEVEGARTAPATSSGKEAVADAAGGAGKPGGRSTFAFGKPKEADKVEAPKITDPAQPGFRHPDGGVTPAWSLVHRGETDLAETWGDAGRGLALGGSVPKELLVRATLPDVASAGAVDLDVGERRLTLKVPGRYQLEVALPYAVDEARGRAKFDKARKQLEVTLPVLPPPLPPAPLAAAARPLVQPMPEPAQAQPTPEPAPEPAAPEPASSAAEAADSAEAEALATVERPGMGAAVEAEEGPSGAGGAEASSSEAQLTENQRRWLELHKRQEEEKQQAAAAAAAAAERGEGEAAGAGQQEAGAVRGQGEAAKAEAEVEVEAAPTVMLAPRLRRDLAMELD